MKHNESKSTMLDDNGKICTECRLLPCGGGGNVIVGYSSFLKEIKFRLERIHDGVPFDLPKWESLEIYFPEK